MLRLGGKEKDFDLS